MKRLIIAILALSGWVAQADVSDPIKGFKATNFFTPGEILYRWDADVNGDGKKLVFLKLKSTDDLNRTNGYHPSWVVYIPAAGGKGYVLSRGTEYAELEKSYPGGGGGPGMDLDRLYVGPISQLGRSGLVTLECDNPYIMQKSYHVNAYVLEKDHLKRIQLSPYADGTNNSIFEQYLSDTHRTKIDLQKVPLDNNGMVADFIDKFAGAFDSDGTGSMMASLQFRAEVPLQDQPDVLASIIDRALSTSPINSHVIYVATSLLSDPKITWTDHVEKTLATMAKSSDGKMSALASSTLGKRK
jgi:hypothetical protein